ncbi:MAG: hypothetical protein ACJAWW_002740 [Sulfurimonas sp.]|jgi:hypothetical protein
MTSIFSIIFTIVLDHTFDYYYDKHILEEKTKYEVQLSKLKYINQQIDEFYIPLQIKLLESEKLWIDYKKKYAGSKVFTDIAHGVTNSDTKKWQIYMLQVFQPIHVRLENIISSKRNLVLKNSSVNQEIDLLIRHISYYKVIFSQWKDDDKTQNFSQLHFPSKLIYNVQKDIDILNNYKKILLK